MSKRTPVTEYANVAMDELFQMDSVYAQITADLKSDEHALEQRNIKLPGVPPITNRPFNNAVSRLIGIAQLCRAVDIYNWYCREAFKLSLSSNPGPVVDAIRNQTGKIAKIIDNADSQGKDAASEIIQKLLSGRASGDKQIRDTIHIHLDVLQNPETELLCECRNILVHKRGHDELGEIAQGIQNLGSNRSLIGVQGYPDGHMPIALDANNNLLIDAEIGGWAVKFIHQQIFMMDQNFSHVYELPRKAWEPQSISRTFLGETNPKQQNNI